MANLAMDRAGLVRRGLRLNYLTLGYNGIEAALSLAAGLVSGSVALVGFGIDSVIEVTASGAAQWRLRLDHQVVHRERVERRTRQVIGACFLALATFIAVDAGYSLRGHKAPQRSLAGLMILTASVIVMPWLARQKRTVAVALSSGALRADATQTALCAYLSAVALVGVGLNLLLGWWWADPVAALGMTPIIVREGWQAMRGTPDCTDCA